METIRERDAKLETLWRQFGDLPMDPETECMEEPFLHFPAGTFREDIWHWFDERYSKGVYHLLYCIDDAKEDREYEIAPGIRLTATELRIAYEKQRHIYDIMDIENELDCSAEEYIEKYGVDKNPVTASEIEEMATLLRDKLDEDADATWSVCRADAVAEILKEREVTDK